MRQRFARRVVLKAGSALAFSAVVSLPLGARQAGDGVTEVRARPGRAQLLPAAEPKTEIWGYGGGVPGPILRVKQGEQVRVRLVNELPQATTIHWHGIRIDNAMDGVAGLTQDAVPPGRHFDYVFTAPDAGTYWYHPHNRSWEQLARGLYGLLIVDEPDPPAFDQDLVLIVDDWRLDEAGQIHEASLGHMRDWSHAGRLGNVLTLNGFDALDLEVRSGERIRLRVCNVANARVLRLRFKDHDPVAVALDGQPLARPAPLAGDLTIAPGQRCDLVIDMDLEPGARTEIVAVDERSGEEIAVAGRFVYGLEARTGRRSAPTALRPNALPAGLDLARARRVDLRMEGGAMGGLQSAVFRGRTLTIRDLVNAGMVWALNGVAGRTDQPLFSAPAGQSLRLRMINDTAWPHAMHVHGHHVRVIEQGGLSAWRDTVLVAPRETVEVAFVADNPGRWMLHCHMLEHQAGGMATWFEVT